MRSYLLTVLAGLLSLHLPGPRGKHGAMARPAFEQEGSLFAEKQPHELLPAAQPHRDDVLYATVYRSDSTKAHGHAQGVAVEQFMLVPGVIDKEGGVAWGRFEDAQNVTGWGVLDIESCGDYSADEQMFAAGVLEGALTARRIYEAIVDVREYEASASGLPNAAVTGFMWAQLNWTYAHCPAAAGDDYWGYNCALMEQFEGLLAGYNAAARAQGLEEQGVYDMWVMQAVGDLFQIVPAMDRARRPRWHLMDSEQAKATARRSQHCSGLIKVAADFSDLYFGHSSFFTYANMNRIYKHYTLPLPFDSLAATSLSFSSYPAFLESLDDFYLLSSGLVMIQTSNSVYNNTLLDLIKPESLLAWQRVRVAHSFAHTGKEWKEVFEQEASGTYVNQYMLINLNLFQPEQALAPDTLWVVEEIPGIVQGADMTKTLSYGYWPSYNEAYFPEIVAMSGNEAMVQQFGSDFSYELAPRAKMFRRDQTNVTSMATMKHVMRYNEWQTDPFSDGHPYNAICSRGDLDPERPSAGGCYDTKVSSFSMAFDASTKTATRRSEAVNGPTAQDQPPFSWATTPASLAESTPHMGQPTTYDFDFEIMKPYEF